MSKFWELLEESVIVQGILTLAVTGVVCYMAITGQEAPKDLWTLLGLAWGFYFGTKTQQQLTTMRKGK